MVTFTIFSNVETNDSFKFLDANIIYQCIYSFSKRYLPLDYLGNPSPNNDLKVVIKRLFGSCFLKFNAHQLMREHFGKDIFEFQNQEIYLIAFKRNLKKLLTLSQSDEDKGGRDWGYVFNRYTNLFRILVESIIDNDSDDKNIVLKESKERTLLFEFIEEIKLNHNKIIENEEPNFTNLVYKFQKFNQLFNIHILQKKNENGKAISFHIRTEPKDLFRGELIETEQRIIAFVDILGFTKMITEYDNDPYSSLLQDIQEAFTDAYKSIIQVHTEQKHGYLEHKLFSDNLCVSVPFYESKEDFLTQYSIIVNLIQCYQLNMLLKGYYVRGAISIGSYYSNENMIFSGGLVKAYHLESKIAEYPRVIICDEIKNWLDDCKNEGIKEKNLSNHLVEAKKDKKYFINPYIDLVQTLDYGKDQITSLFSDKNNETMEIFRSVLGTIIDDSKDSLPQDVKELISPVDEKLENNIKNLIFSMKPIPKKPWYKKILKQICNEKKSTPLQKLLWLQNFNKWAIDGKEDEDFKFYN